MCNSNSANKYIVRCKDVSCNFIKSKAIPIKKSEEKSLENNKCKMLLEFKHFRPELKNKSHLMFEKVTQTFNERISCFF